MFNFYDKVKSTPHVFNQFEVKELLFVHFKCPVTARTWDVNTQFNYLQYIPSGKQAYHTPGRSWEFKAGDLYFVKRGACIIEKFFEEPLTILTFFIPDSYLQNFMRDSSFLKAVNHKNTDAIIPLHANDIINGYMESVIPYFYAENKPPEALLELKFRELLIALLNDPQNTDLKIYLHQIGNPGYDPLQEVMNANCLYNLALEDYAKMLNRSLSSFKRHFTSVYKTSPGQWLQMQKLNNAYKLLLNTDKPIAHISFECGFENSEHFSRLFRKRFGTSPLYYRKQESSRKAS